MFKTLHLVWFMGNKHCITIMWVKQCHKPAMTGNGLYHLFMVIWGIRFLIFGFLAVGTSCRLYFLSLYTGWLRNVKNGFPSSWIRIIPNMLGTPYNQPTGFWTLLKWLCLFCLKMSWKKKGKLGEPLNPLVKLSLFSSFSGYHSGGILNGWLVAWCFGARYHQPKLSINRWLKAGSGFKQSQNAWILDMHTYIYMYIHIYIWHCRCVSVLYLSSANMFYTVCL